MSSKLPWFRMYTETIDSEKLGLLAFEDRWHFVALLCLKGKGVLDAEDSPEMLRRKVGLKLGLTLAELEKVAMRLSAVKLIDFETFQPLAWEERQMLSDSSADRVKAYRDRQKQGQSQVAKQVKRDGNVTVTVQDKDKEEDTDKEKEKNIDALSFENAWAVYPKRPGSSKGAALKAWSARLKSGDTAQAMLSGASAYAAYCTATKKDVEYIRHAATFFGPSRFFDTDYAVPQGSAKGSLNLLPENTPRIPNLSDPDTMPDWLREPDGSVPLWLREDYVMEAAHAG